MSKNNKKKTPEERNKLFVRILAGFLAVLMIAGMAYYTILILTSSVGAVSYDEETTEEVIETSSLKDSGDVLIRVGLMYGSNITTGFQVETTDGFTIGSQDLNGDYDFHEIWSLRDTIISCTSDDNLSKYGMTFLIADDPEDTVIGGYHLEVACGDLERDQLEDLIHDTEWDADDLGLMLIPSYIDGEYALRVGAFSSWDEADAYLRDVEDLYPEYRVSIAEPSETAVSVLQPEDDLILFEYDGYDDTEIGLTAEKDENGNTYMMTPAGNIYDGVFCFKRYDNGETDGVSLINILPLEAYIAGVLPYEISNTWPLEALKAFALTVRSYTCSHLHKHEKYSFDFCNTTDCQVYKGAGRINERVIDAVLDTAGKVLVYDDQIVHAYYSSSVGGVTVSAQDAWGGPEDVPYLQAVETPWENYMVHNNGFWITEVSPKALLERLHTAGYEELDGAIEEVEILDLCRNSTYIKELLVTDIYGTSVTLQYADVVRTSLTPYVKSANFVVGKGEVEYTEHVLLDYVEDDPSEDISAPDQMYDRDYGYINLDEYYVMRSDSMDRASMDGSVSIMTGNGDIQHDRYDIFVMARENAAAYLGDAYLSYVPKEEETKHQTSIVEDKSTPEVLTKIAYAEDEDNFIFVGKGWGHGVGISQFGSRDMANLGYMAEEILHAYFGDCDIVDFRDIT